MFTEGQQVRVIDDECPLHRQVVTIIGPNPRCTAEWVVWDEKDKPWVIHSCRLRPIRDDFTEAQRVIACDIDMVYGLLRDLGVRLVRIGERCDDLGLVNTEADLAYAVSRIEDALMAMLHTTTPPLG